SYKDGKGAKIAFLKLYGYRLERSACIAKLQKKASWTPFYPPEPGWLKETFPGLEFEEGE
ncbi:MAG: hypothetical protein GY757_08820, partial [bacterium]|nr:hypothetical protein [bacterium]